MSPGSHVEQWSVFLEAEFIKMILNVKSPLYRNETFVELNSKEERIKIKL